jgi:undecaprenyl diphosphate synthase
MNNSISTFHAKGEGPFHIGIIPDGGRRWANRNNVSLIDSYAKSKAIILDVIKYFFTENVDEISIYLSSIQNFKRTEIEILSFCEAISRGLDTDFLTLAYQLKIKINIVGEKEILPDK